MIGLCIFLEFVQIKKKEFIIVEASSLKMPMTLFLCHPQRATLAEKEVTSLKEQLANHGGTGGGNGGSSSTGAAAMAPPPPEREDSLISPHSQHKNDYEVVAAKDKEVSTTCQNEYYSILFNFSS